MTETQINRIAKCFFRFTLTVPCAFGRRIFGFVLANEFFILLNWTVACHLIGGRVFDRQFFLSARNIMHFLNKYTFLMNVIAVAENCAPNFEIFRWHVCLSIDFFSTLHSQVISKRERMAWWSYSLVVNNNFYTKQTFQMTMKAI